MQAASILTPTPLTTVRPSIRFRTQAAFLSASFSRLPTAQCLRIRASAAPNDTSTVDYNSAASVFPAEACETVGGEACEVDMYPEVKLKQEDGQALAKVASELVEREYLEYNNNPKTVFPGEACDDLGGEFCEPEYQSGVFSDK